MHSIGEFFVLLFVSFRVKWFLIKEKHEVRCRYPSFRSFERALNRKYLFRNPYRICKYYLKQKGEKDLDVYGETPLPLLFKIAHECELGSKDILYELGCGRGRGAIFLSHIFRCKVVGIDWIPFFIETARNIVSKIEPSLSVIFRCAEMHEVDFSDATIIFLYGTCLSEEFIEAMISRFKRLSPQIKIITISYPLSDYSPFFHVHKQFSGTFPWGDGEIYVNTISEK